MTDSGNSDIPPATEQGNKPNNLRDRIAAALQAADEDWITYTNPYPDMADAVIKELQLEERTRTPVTAYTNGQFQDGQTLHRYVTPWKIK